MQRGKLKFAPRTTILTRPKKPVNYNENNNNNNYHVQLVLEKPLKHQLID